MYFCATELRYIPQMYFWQQSSSLPGTATAVISRSHTVSTAGHSVLRHATFPSEKKRYCTYWKKVYDREEWRRLLRTARNHRILFMPMDWLIDCTRWFKYDRDWLCVNKPQSVPVILEPPCTYRNWPFSPAVIFSKQQFYLRFDILTLVTAKTTVFCDVTQCTLVCGHTPQRWK